MNPWLEVNWIGITYRDSQHVSPYGDPELALIWDQETVPDVIDVEPDRLDEIIDMLALLGQTDKVVLTLCRHGWRQEDIGEVVGLTQPSVCARIKGIRKWLERNVELRDRVHRHFPTGCPPWVTAACNGPIDDTQLWELVIARHCSPSEAARILRRSQSTIYGRLRRMHRLAVRHGSPEQAEILSRITGRRGSWDWQRPPDHTALRGVDYVGQT